MALFGFIGQFPWGPGIHRAAGVGRRGAGQGDDLNDLLSAEGGWGTRPRGIGEHFGNQRAQGRLVGVHGSEVGCGSRPARTPAADGLGRAGELVRNLLVGEASGGGQDDLDAADERLGRTVLAQQAVQDRLLGWRDRDGERLGARHRSPF